MKKWIARFLVFAALLALIPAALAAEPTFPDIKDAQTAKDVAVLQMLGIIEGDGGKFMPDGTLTRAAFCKMAVIISGRGGEEPQYRSRTVFPDVRSDHWARGYINLASSGENKIISGNSDGTFCPDDNITYAQAITILLRMLGRYDEAGLLWPADHIRFAADIGLTEGLEVSARSPIPRAAAARLFVNLLNTEMKEKALFLTTLGTPVEDAIVMDLDAEAADGTTGAIKTSQGIYKAKNGIVPEAILGLRGTLITKDGATLAFVPGGGRSVTFIAASADSLSANSSWIKGHDGKQYNIPQDALVYTPEAKFEFKTYYINIASGTQITLFYKNEAVDAVYCDARQSADAYTVTGDSVTPSAFDSLTGGDRGYKIYKNGYEASYSDIRKYDVAIYNKSAKILSVSDFRVTAGFETLWPDAKVKFLGMTFEILPFAQERLSGFKANEVVTFLLTADNKVADVRSTQEVYGAPIGIVSSVSASDAKVTLLNGIEFSGDPQLKTQNQIDNLTGQLVSVSSPKANCITLSRVGFLGSYNLPADLNTMTFGTAKISPGVKIIDKVGTSRAIEVSQDELMQGRIPGDKILYIGKDSTGDINLIVMNNATGNLYDYGFLQLDIYTQTNEFGSSEQRRAAVKNSKGTTTPVVTGADFKNDEIGGIALSIDGKSVASLIKLIRADNIRRSGFKTINGTLYASIPGGDIPVAENVQCYNRTTGKWLSSLDEARAASENLTVYYDRPAAENGKVRIVVIT